MSKPDQTTKKLHIEVMKGKFNFRCILSNEGLDHCCKTLLVDPQFAPVLDESMDSEDQVAAIQRINTQDWTSGDSQMDPIDLNADEVLSDSDDEDAVWTFRPQAKTTNGLAESGWVSVKGKAPRTLEPESEE